MPDFAEYSSLLIYPTGIFGGKVFDSNGQLLFSLSVPLLSFGTQTNLRSNNQTIVQARLKKKLLKSWHVIETGEATYKLEARSTLRELSYRVDHFLIPSESDGEDVIHFKSEGKDAMLVSSPTGTTIAEIIRYENSFNSRFSMYYDDLSPEVFLSIGLMCMSRLVDHYVRH